LLGGKVTISLYGCSAEKPHYYYKQIATCYGVDDPGIGKPVGERFSALVQTGPVAHPASCKMSTGSLAGVKQPGS
jgi:hypothetical protein